MFGPYQIISLCSVNAAVVSDAFWKAATAITNTLQNQNPRVSNEHNNRTRSVPTEAKLSRWIMAFVIVKKDNLNMMPEKCKAQHC